MNHTAIVEIREVYGNKTIYPVNEVAKNIARLAGTKTLTTGTVALAKNMGFAFEIAQPITTI
jgi:hypothetical protein